MSRESCWKKGLPRKTAYSIGEIFNAGEVDEEGDDEEDPEE